MAWTEERRQKASLAAKERMNYLHKVETCNGEEIPEVVEDKQGLGFQMSHEEKLQSMLNAVKILPPNLIKEGRHSIENVQALNCFKVTPKMMDEVYEKYTHPEF